MPTPVSGDSYDVRIEKLRAFNSTLRGRLEFERQRLWNTIASRRGALVRRSETASNGNVAEVEDPATRVPLSELTPREREVLKCIAEGNSTRETAERLGITFKTAACHRHRLMQKLDVHETSSAVRLAIRAGLVKP
jgi:DNA-binding NarL/FixJ family response regulator